MRSIDFWRRRAATILTVLLVMLPAAAFPSDDPYRFDKYLGTEWYGLYLQGGKIGYASSTWERTSRPIEGWRVDTEMTMIISVMGKTDSMTTKDVRFFQAPGGELYSSKAIFSGGTGIVTIDGAREADEYIVTTYIGGQVSTLPLPFPVDYLDSLAYLKTEVTSGNLTVGDSLLISSFEPTPPLTGRIHQSLKMISKDAYIFNGIPTVVYTAEWTFQELCLQ